MYPNQFKRKYDMPSFDVNDLHKVDEMIIENIYNELRKDDWTLLIAHFLGVDHCGHKFGPRSTEMREKLAQMNEVIQNVSQTMMDETLLIVIGDHGMTETGDHGGDALKEIDAALFLYSRERLVFSKPDHYVAQIDVVPTLSLLLGLPIPFSNIGIVIDSLFPRQLISRAVEINFHQIHNYVQFLKKSMPDLSVFLESSNETLESATSKQVFMRNLQSFLRESWTNFDVQLMLYAFTFLIRVVFHIMDSITKRRVNERNLIELIPYSVLPFFICWMQFFFVLTILTALNIIAVIRRIWCIFEFSFDLPTTFMLFILLVHAFSFLSNSYIVFESDTVRFLSQSLFIVVVCSRFAPFRGSIQEFRCFGSPCSGEQNGSLTLFEWLRRRYLILYRILISTPVLILLRFGKLYERCREEQQNACLETIFAVPLTKAPYGWLKLFRFFSGSICLFAVGVQFIKQSSQYKSGRLFVYFLVSFIVAILAYWGMVLVALENVYTVFLGLMIHIAFLLPILKLLLVITVKCFSSGYVIQKQDRFIVSGFFMLFLMFILGDGVAPAVAGFLLIISCTFSYLDNECHTIGFLSIFSSCIFFATSHQCTFSSIPWQAAFIGVSANSGSLFLPAILVFMHIFSNQIFTIFCLLHIPKHSYEKETSYVQKSVERPVLPRFIKHAHIMVLFESFKLVSVQLSMILHKRHLMMWKVFAPKFVFQSLSFVVFSISLSLVSLLFQNME